MAAVLDKFCEAIGGHLADGWAGAELAWMPRHDALTTPRTAMGRLGKQPAPDQMLAVVALLGAVAASAIVVRRLTTPALRLTEGYWPAPLRALWNRRSAATVPMRSGWSSVGTSSWNYSRAAPRQPMSWLSSLTSGNGPGACRARSHYLPTRAGNTLRAAGARPTWKYGLNAPALWPYLWLLLPGAARSEIGQARAALDSLVAAGIWPLAFACFCFTLWAWWAAPAGTGVLLASCLFWLPARAGVYAGLVEASSDLYRGHWPGVADRKNPAAALERI
jgi:hypothetical protein